MSNWARLSHSGVSNILIHTHSHTPYTHAQPHTHAQVLSRPRPGAQILTQSSSKRGQLTWPGPNSRVYAHRCPLMNEAWIRFSGYCGSILLIYHQLRVCVCVCEGCRNTHTPAWSQFPLLVELKQQSPFVTLAARRKSSTDCDCVLLGGVE